MDLPIIPQNNYYLATHKPLFGPYFMRVKVLEIKPMKQKYSYKMYSIKIHKFNDPHEESLDAFVRRQQAKNPNYPGRTWKRDVWIHNVTLDQMQDRFLRI